MTHNQTLRTVRGMSIHARIRERREALGLSQEKLGELVGVTYQTVQQWEREPGEGEGGKQRLSTAPSRKRLASVAAILGVTEQWLLTGTDGHGVTVDPTEGQLLLFYRGMPDEVKVAMLSHANALYNAVNPTKRSAANPFPQAELRKKGSKR